MMRYVLYWRCPESISEKIRNLAFEMGGIPTKIEPHCSIFHCYAEEKNESAIIDAVSIDYSSFKNPLMKLSDADYLTPNMFVLKVEKNNDIQSMHDTVLERTKSLPLSKQEKILFNTSDELLSDNYNKYGFPYFGKSFNPHVSICKVSEEIYKKNIDRTLSEKFYSEKIILIRKNDMKILKEFIL